MKDLFLLRLATCLLGNKKIFKVLINNHSYEEESKKETAREDHLLHAWHYSGFCHSSYLILTTYLAGGSALGFVTATLGGKTASLRSHNL